MILAVELYDQVLRELITAVGAALFVANGFALVRRRRGEQSRGAPGPGDGQLTKAPIARTVTFMLVGLVIMIWGIASLLA